MQFRRRKTTALMKTVRESSLKTSTDNLCGPSEEGLNKSGKERGFALSEGRSKPTKFFLAKSLIMAQIERWRQA